MQVVLSCNSKPVPWPKSRPRQRKMNHCIFYYRLFSFLYPISSFLYPLSTFLYTPPPRIFSTYPILPHSERVFYSTVTCTLSGCKNVHCNRPIPSHPPTHPAQPPPGPPHHPPPAPPGPPHHPPPGPAWPATPAAHPVRQWTPTWTHRACSNQPPARALSQNDRGIRGVNAAWRSVSTARERRQRGVSTARERRHCGVRGASVDQAVLSYIPTDCILVRNDLYIPWAAG